MKNFTFILTGIIIGGLMVFLINYTKETPKYFIESQSKYSFDETVAQFEASVSEIEGWKILHTYNLQQSMEKHGYKVMPVKVFSLCNPDYSSKILFSNQERVISSMMPCRVSIYVKTDGNTYISTMNSTNMAAQIGGLVNDVMSKASADVNSIINDLLLD